MYKKIIITFIITSYVLISAPIALSELPPKSIEFANQYFPKHLLYRAIEDFGNYTLIFKNGLKIFVNNKGDWFLIGDDNGIKINFLEKSVQRTIKKEYPKDIIINVRRNKDHYIIKLMNQKYIKITFDGAIIK